MKEPEFLKRADNVYRTRNYIVKQVEQQEQMVQQINHKLEDKIIVVQQKLNIK